MHERANFDLRNFSTLPLACDTSWYWFDYQKTQMKGDKGKPEDAAADSCVESKQFYKH